MNRPASALRILLSFAFSLPLTLAFALPYWNAEKYVPLDKAALLVVPAFSLTFLFHAFFSRLPDDVSGAALARLASQINPARWLGGWLLGLAAAALATGFSSRFYPLPVQVFLLSLFWQWLFGALAFYALGRARRLARRRPTRFAAALALFLALIAFEAKIFLLNSQFPVVFEAGVFLLESAQLPAFFLAGLLSLPLLAWSLFRLQQPPLAERLTQNRFVAFLRENFAGLTFAALFFYLYLLIGAVLNFPDFDVDDIFFDSDGFIWRFRLTTEAWRDFYWRSVHPLALILLKPSVNFLSLFLNGDLHFAAILLNALAGAACVFLAWMFLRGALADSLAALLIAALLGVSASHLLFGSLIETYIFLAAASLFGFVLAQRKNLSPALWALAGALTMGITLTNFAQTLLAFFSLKPNFKRAIRYGATVVSLTISLTLLGNVFYPNAAPYFFVPSTFLAERQNVRPVSRTRAVALVRAFAFNNFAAPEPLTSYKDVPFTQFRFYRAEDGTLSRYATPLQALAEKIWLAFLLLSAFFFIRDFRSHPPGLTLALVGCVLFNWLLHLHYGKELFLYSPNWTYAVALLLGLAWKRPLRSAPFQFAFAALLALLMWNNAALFETILRLSVPHLTR